MVRVLAFGVRDNACPMLPVASMGHGCDDLQGSRRTEITPTERRYLCYTTAIDGVACPGVHQHPTIGKPADLNENFSTSTVGFYHF